MSPELTITTERINDFPLLLATMQRLGLSWSWIATIWLAHILSQGDHRKLPVQAWPRR
jgi:hypothetical protein